MFSRYIQVLEGIVMHPTGATAGMIQKTNPILTRGQVQRTCRELIEEGFVRTQKAPYKGNIEKVLYFVTEKSHEYCGYIVDKYERAEKQMALELEVSA
jgi:DNA-binding HxlR family transcriptional regulator